MIIDFYIPARHKRKTKWIPPSQRGKILEFPKKETPEQFIARMRDLLNGNQCDNRLVGQHPDNG